MKVIFVGAGPGDPELLTVKARRLLENCSIIIYAGSLVSPAVMALVPQHAQRYDSAGMNLGHIMEVCAQAQAAGVDVIRLHSGDPSIYGAIREQMNGLDGLGIDYEVVPGVSAFQAAAAGLKTELTAPEVSQSIILTRTSGRTPLPPEQELNRLAHTHATLCIYLSGTKIDAVTADLIPHYGGQCPAAVVYHASWDDEVIIRGCLDDLAEKVRQAKIGQTALILVGKALGRDLPASKLYDAAFTHGFRKAGDA